MIDIDALEFPELLPGHKWVVRMYEDSMWSYDAVAIAIRKDRRWFASLGYGFIINLTQSVEELKKVGYRLHSVKDPRDGEQLIPADEEGQWRMYIMKSAHALHDEYVAKHKIPIQYKKMKTIVANVNEELNE